MNRSEIRHGPDGSTAIVCIKGAQCKGIGKEASARTINGNLTLVCSCGQLAVTYETEDGRHIVTGHR